ncbi:solute carrier family 35 member G2-like [Saccoglossus kowalevskii]|uniref:Solute carrier family 35 member G2-like n=1 Tax=Saccoglossus kowalevskii TaxID=10224 RepID=A0ABM0MKU1_SACKO|nr:PREDICTED: solute carrier family 35 member G2-like [Saccoglossus kowalevskii]
MKQSSEKFQSLTAPDNATHATNEDISDSSSTSCCDGGCGRWCHGHLHSLEGMLMALLSGISLAVSSIYTRLSSDGGVPRFHTTFINNIPLAPVVIPFMVYYKVNPICHERWRDTLVILLLGCGRAVVIMAQTISFTYVNSGNAVALLNGITAVAASLLASLFLREKCRLIGIVAICVDIVGIVLLIRPPFIFGHLSESYGYTMDLTIGYSLITVAAVILAIVIVASRKLLQRVSILIVTFYAGVMGFVLSLIFMLALETSVFPITDLSLIFYLSLMAISYTIAFYTLYRAVQVQDASTCALLRNISIVVAFVLQHYVLETRPTLLDIIGASLILVGTSVVSLETWWIKTHRKDEEEDLLLSEDSGSEMIPITGFGATIDRDNKHSKCQ